LLRENEVEVTVLEDQAHPIKPDAIFPNNWFCTLKNELVLFPIYAPNRRAEKRPELIERIKSVTGIDKQTDYSNYESKKKFLEGTGSMVLDRVNKLVYACRSERTDPDLVKLFAKEHDFIPILFSATDEAGREIYHTNVMMNIGKQFAVVCLDAIRNTGEKQLLLNALQQHRFEIIPIHLQQMKQFAGNMLQLSNKNGEDILVMSSRAFSALTNPQIASLQNHTRIIHADVSHIEQAAGGSVRCMMAELF